MKMLKIRLKYLWLKITKKYVVNLFDLDNRQHMSLVFKNKNINNKIFMELVNEYKNECNYPIGCFIYWLQNKGYKVEELS